MGRIGARKKEKWDQLSPERFEFYGRCEECKIAKSSGYIIDVDGAILSRSCKACATEILRHRYRPEKTGAHLHGPKRYNVDKSRMLDHLSVTEIEARKIAQYLEGRGYSKVATYPAPESMHYNVSRSTTREGCWDIYYYGPVSKS